jgi:hypothetical protein
MRSVLDTLPQLSSVLDMTTDDNYCDHCGNDNADELENDTITVRRKKVTYPRCIDRRACERRVKREAEEAHADELATAKANLAGCRQWVKEAEQELALAVQRALAENVSASVVARAAGISRERVYQIRDGRR